MIRYYKFIIVVGCLFLSACSSKAKLEKELSPSFSVPSYQYGEYFSCVTAPKVNISRKAVNAYHEAEQLSKNKNATMAQKIKAFENAEKMGHPDALKGLLRLYEKNNEAIIKRVKPIIMDDPNSMSATFQQGDQAAKLLKSSKYENEISALKTKIAKDNTSLDGLVNLAKLKIDGREVYKDKKKAFDYLMFASQKGNSLAQEQLGEFYFYQLGEYKKGVQALECAVSQGNVEAYHQLAIGALVFEKNPPKSLSLHVKASDKGSIKSLTLLRGVFRDGQMGYEKDKELANCFNQFIKEYANMPSAIYGVEEACPLPEHPKLGYGETPMTPEKKAEIAKIEREFNPSKEQTVQEKYMRQKAKEDKILNSGKKLPKSGIKNSRF